MQVASPNIGIDAFKPDGALPDSITAQMGSKATVGGADGFEASLAGSVDFGAGSATLTIRHVGG